MQDDRPNRRRSKRWGVFVAALALYVLSVGPVCWTIKFLFLRFPDREDSWGICDDALEAVYAPLLWVGADSDWFDAVLTWYTNLL